MSFAVTKHCRLLKPRNFRLCRFESQYEKEQKPTPTRKIHGEEYPEWRGKWTDRKGEWDSKINLFKPDDAPHASVVLGAMQKGFNLRPASVKNWWNTRKELVEIANQTFNPNRHEALGNDLATAHFICFRGGAVRFLGDNHWIRCKLEGENEGLPKKYVEGIFVESVDCENIVNGGLRYEGLDNLCGLQALQWLSLKDNKLIDDWGIDRMTGLLYETLEYLDIRGCDITHRSLVAISKLSKLKFLIISNDKVDQAMELSCSMLQEAMPDLLIKFSD